VYEKKSQTQLQSSTEKSWSRGNSIGEKAGEVSSLFAEQLNHASQLCGAEPPADEEPVREL